MPQPLQLCPLNILSQMRHVVPLPHFLINFISANPMLCSGAHTLLYPVSNGRITLPIVMDSHSSRLLSAFFYTF
jgi:hypothetical protein